MNSNVAQLAVAPDANRCFTILQDCSSSRAVRAGEPQIRWATKAMSYDLGVFFTTRAHTDEEAVRRYVAYCEDQDLSASVEPSPSVQAFLKELTETFPQIDDWPEESIDECPWSCAFDVSDGHVLMPMMWSAADKMPPIIVALAAKHGLVCVDPQSERILTAPWPQTARAPWWKFWS